MKYKSTRGSKVTKIETEAIIQGLAEDKGLYVPDGIPNLPFELDDMRGKSYQEIAFGVMKAFFPNFTDEEMKSCIYEAYDDKFETEDIAPIVNAGGVSFLELYHGKTSAFKDMALSILPYLLTTAIKKEKEDKKICILTATSGDTGKAALEGFADVDGTEIIVFYPKEGVSEVQERQMVSQVGENTHVLAVNGNFDDAQTGVKNVLNDENMKMELEKDGIKLSSANSINIGRLVPQVAYYVYTYVKMLERGTIKNGESINVSVPTGNFGNILAAYYAKEMGVPIKKFICASNENKVLTDFINTGTYSIKRDFHLTNSPSMDILISSNLERLLYHLSGNNGIEIKALMDSLEKEKTYTVSDSIKEGLNEFYGGFATVKETNETIGELYRDCNYLVDTHTAVAYKVYRDYIKKTGDNAATIIVSTASPYKFANSVSKAIGLKNCKNGFEYVKELNKKTGVKIPVGLQDLDKKEIIHSKVLEREEIKNSIKVSLKGI